MYIPRSFSESDQARLGALIDANPFGVLVTVDGVRPVANHLPFLYEQGKLVCHLAKTNTQISSLECGDEALAIFTGPHAYVSPSWYDTPGVPTWNYTVVHVYGEPIVFRDETRLRDVVSRLTRRHEAGQPDPWRPNYDDRLLQAIVGVEIIVNEMQGKFKLSQNRPEVDRNSVISHLESDGSDLGRGVAKLMRADKS